MSDSFDVIVIGGGPAGVTAALRARELGASVALVEARKMGGTCTNDGCVPVRALAHAARLVREARQSADYGVACPTVAPDFRQVMARARAIVRAVLDKKDLPGTLARAGVELFDGAGDAQFVDPHTIRISPNKPGQSARALPEAPPRIDAARTLRAKSFILCTGGRPRPLPCPGAELTLSPVDVWSLTTLPARLAVVGASATGCQLASIFAALGSRVTLLDMAPRLLPGIDPDASAALAEAFGRRDITVITGVERIDRVATSGSARQLSYVHRGEPRTLDADAVLVSIGWPGNADRLNPAAAGIEIDKKHFVTVNEHQQSVSASHVFAAGDGDGTVLLVQAAHAEGTLAAENAVLGATRTIAHPIVPHGGFTDPEYGAVGLTEEDARKKYPQVVAAAVPYAELDRAVIDDRREGLCKLVVEPTSRRILGAHVVGEDATEVVQIVATAMAGGLTVHKLAEVEFSYPTYTAIVGLAARAVVRKMRGEPRSHDGRAEWERGV
ncbi:MAG: NAD(P)/FAD-dependent oxidoreductase [Phycisphaerae bacterium]|nr:NAD(P)/FAD-dependent oxidoreductase [Tepidisphaeraceae bacterium]